MIKQLKLEELNQLIPLFDQYMVFYGKASAPGKYGEYLRERIEKDELCRILLMINKKRGYKSSRKLKTDEGQEIDGMSIAKKLYDDLLTPGQ
jgi:hypothetical protein